MEFPRKLPFSIEEHIPESGDKSDKYNFDDSLYPIKIPATPFMLNSKQNQIKSSQNYNKSKGLSQVSIDQEIVREKPVVGHLTPFSKIKSRVFQEKFRSKEAFIESRNTLSKELPGRTEIFNLQKTPILINELKQFTFPDSSNYKKIFQKRKKLEKLLDQALKKLNHLNLK